MPVSYTHLEEMLGYFKMLDLEYDAEAKEVIAPTFRHDLFRLADLAEEVARFYGYDNIPTTLPAGESTTGKLSFKLRIEQVARDIAEFCGFSQGMTYSFESPKVFDKLLIPADSPLRSCLLYTSGGCKLLQMRRQGLPFLQGIRLDRDPGLRHGASACAGNVRH